MSDAPERIWASVKTPLAAMKSGSWHQHPYGVGYIRADIAEAKASDLQAKLTECCLQALATDGQASEAVDRAIKAEAEAATLRAKLAVRASAKEAAERLLECVIYYDLEDRYGEGIATAFIDELARIAEDAP